MKRYLILALFIVAPSCDDTDTNGAAKRKPIDYTKVNERELDASTKTPFDQAQNPSDIEITAKIRKAVVGDDALSMNAKNVKIITSDAVVTLRGPVSSTDERSRIVYLARGTASVKRVDDLIEVAPD